MAQTYDPSTIESKWQKRWEESGVHKVNFKKAKNPYYCLVMFPYPSGSRLHVGHWFQYSIPDSFSRFMRMRGKDVLHPIGFDAFGLPAENNAIKKGLHPNDSTQENVDYMIKQYKRMGCTYDWSKTLNTSEPEYYRWTQWLFLQMYKAGLAYHAEGNVNFCPDCKTVLANEQVWDGKCERCENEVVQKPLTQWFWKITKYSDQLLEGLEKIEWPEKTKLMQKHWIGKKKGVDITYEIKGANETITCFTTRPDTNFGATFVVLAPEHPFVQKIVKSELPSDKKKCVESYVQSSLKKTELERQEEGKKKTGADTGYVAINNLNGREMPIWVSDFVLAGFGTGAVVGVPGHDVRDFEFATTFNLPIIRVVIGPDGDASDITQIEQVQEESGTMTNSGFLDGMQIMDAKEKIMDYFVKKGWGKRVTTYRLRDWLISRQRYWGAPIPIVYDPEGNPHPIPEQHLPWELPTDVEFKPKGKSPLAQSKELIERTEKIFGKGWKPEVDTMDTFVCSSFYQFRFLSEGNQKEFIPKNVEKKWMPVDLYIGGPEHACMHLIYARFVAMVLKELGHVNAEEPFQSLIHQGLITNKGAKMSKSKGNVVSPDEFVEKYGSDVFRMYLMFMGSFTHGGDWSDGGIKGIDRFTKRIYSFFSNPQKISSKEDKPSITPLLHQTIKKVTDDISSFGFNTAISALMIMLNEIEKAGSVTSDTAKTFTKLLAPLAPHLAEEMWELTGSKGFVIESEWSTYDKSRLISDTFTLVVQVNGKVRANMEVPADISEVEAISQAKAQESVQKYISGRNLKKEVYIAGKLVSLVV